MCVVYSAAAADPGHQASLQVLLALLPSHVLVSPCSLYFSVSFYLFISLPKNGCSKPALALSKATHQRESDGQRSQARSASLRSVCVCVCTWFEG